MEIIKKQLSPEVFVEIDLQDAKLILKFEHTGASGKETFMVEESLKYFIDKEMDKAPEWMKPILKIIEGVIP